MRCCFLISHILPHLPQFIILHYDVFPFLLYSSIPRKINTLPMKINVSKCNYNICKACAIVSSIQKLILSFILYLSRYFSLFLYSFSLFFCLFFLSLSISFVHSFSLDPSLFRSFFLSLFLLWWIELRYEYGYDNRTTAARKRMNTINTSMIKFKSELDKFGGLYI